MIRKLSVVLCGVLVSSAAWGFNLEVAESPTTSLSLTVSAIQSAQQSLYLNIYELSSSDVADALLARIRAGVHVEIIEEGQPVGGVSAAARGIQAQLAQAMRDAGGSDHLFEMTSHASGGTHASKRRFHYDHAKYAVIDGKDLLIGSENYSPTGNPESGSKGNRGWEVLIHDASIASEFAQVFTSDSSLSAGDLVDLTVSDAPCTGASCSSSGYPGDGPLGLAAASSDSAWLAPLTASAPTAFAGTTLQASDVVRVTSPDTSLSGLLALLNSAQKTLDIEQMTFDSNWTKNGGQSPLLTAVIAAARRGVKVRVLLNDEQVFAHPSHPTASKNLATIDALNQLGRSERLDVSAATADIKKMGVTYIHNKGVLVDGNKTLISSINWDSNAVLNNREAAVVLTSSDVFAHYEALFDSDWQASAGSQHSAEFSAPVASAETSGVHEISIASDACPTRLRVTVAIGALRVSDPDEASFASLSNTHFSADFARTPGSHTCVLADTRSSSRRFIEIRKKADGTRSAVLEGYTANGSVYSIRTVLDNEGPFDGTYEAAVSDGSGPSHAKLGVAALQIETRIGAERR